MLTSSSNGNDFRVSHNYRMPVHQKRSNGTDPYNPNVPTRSPSPNPTGRISRQRRHSTPHISTVRFLELKQSQPNPGLKQHHHHHLDGKPIPTMRERSPIPNRSDGPFSRRRSRSLVKRYYPDDYVTPSTVNPNPPTNFKDFGTRKNLRTIAETSVTSSSEAPLVNQDSLNRKTWKDRNRFHLGVSQHDGFFFDEETLSQIVSRTCTERSQSVLLSHFQSCKTVPDESCSWCSGTCLHRFVNCSCCVCYYRCPFCCWISCLLLALGLVIVIFLVIGFFPAWSKCSDVTSILDIHGWSLLVFRLEMNIRRHLEYRRLVAPLTTWIAFLSALHLVLLLVRSPSKGKKSRADLISQHKQKNQSAQHFHGFLASVCSCELFFQRREINCRSWQASK